MDIDELISIVTLKKLEDDKFEGQNYKTVWGRIFGGQVLSQSLHAAYQTVPENRIAHSMHAYFILPGDLNEPVIYEVDNIRKTSDPIENIKSLLNKIGVEEKTLKDIDTNIKSIIAEAAKFAQDSPEPSEHELFTDVTIN